MGRRRRPTLNTLLLSLRDGEWHSLDEIRTKFDIAEDKLVTVLSFLSEYSFIEFDRANRRARVTANAENWLSPHDAYA